MMAAIPDNRNEPNELPYCFFASTQPKPTTMNTSSSQLSHPVNRPGVFRKTRRITGVALVGVAALFHAQAADAANIVWVTDANDPATGFFPAGSGFTDSGFVTLLQNAGHNVIRYNPPAAVATLLSTDELAA